MALTSPRAGARLNLPRDLQIAYVIGRMGAVAGTDLWPVFYTSRTSARFGWRRLVKLGILRSFERREQSQPAWLGLTRAGREWVVEQVGCAEEELRVMTGLGRVNLDALGARNRLWISLILAGRTNPEMRLALFRPEWELRVAKETDVPVVPDALFVLESSAPGTAPGGSIAFMTELDAGSERLAVWTEKARSYALLRAHPMPYGVERWYVLAVVPTIRRARTLASAVVAGGGGHFVYIGVARELAAGQVLTAPLWRAVDLAHAGKEPVTLAALLGIPATPHQCGPSEVMGARAEKVR